MPRIKIFLFVFCCLYLGTIQGQLLDLQFIPDNPMQLVGAKTKDHTIKISLPFFSAEINHEKVSAASARIDELVNANNLKIFMRHDENFHDGFKANLTISNTGTKTVSISNIIPWGGEAKQVYISGKPLTDSSRSFLFRPGKESIGVIVPHNNNDLNFSAIEVEPGMTLYALIKRSPDTIQNYLLFRSPYLLKPGNSIQFDFYADLVNGDWHDALTKCFQEKFLYEVNNFDKSLYNRKDLQYIRDAYTMHLMFAWDKEYYSAKDSSYRIKEFIDRMKSLYGGDDIFTIWPTWPVLGLDQRSQWQLMENLPGGLEKQKELSKLAHSAGMKYFISYNPWDDADENISLQKMTDMLRRVDADGVILDTKAEAEKKLQDAADRAKAGVVLYSEGMAVPKDMQGIISGRVHNDIYYPPLLNLNKLINPRFAIFRVIEVARERTRREYSSALFNGYGVEINVMRPGRPDWIDDDYKYWGRCVRILRDNSGNFHSDKWTPLVDVAEDKIYVNKWPGTRKTIYTIFNLRPEGFHGKLIELNPLNNEHVVDLWNHEEINLVQQGSKRFCFAHLDAFDPEFLGTNNEGSVSALGLFHKYLVVQTDGDKLSAWSTDPGIKKIKIWPGNPSYDKNPVEFDTAFVSFHLFKQFGRREGKYVVQLFDQNELMDEVVIMIPPGTPLLISEIETTPPASTAPEGMVKIPPGKFLMKVANGDEFIAYPKKDFPKTLEMKSFFIDKYPVTNKQFKTFLTASNYRPADTTNFLKHWIHGSIPAGQENFPVIYVSYEDAIAFAKWSGKRLPTEAEWQYAAQTKDGRNWPWGNDVKQAGSKQKTISSTLTLVDYGEPDPSYCNIGDGKLYPVGKYKKGANPFGIEDLVGSVWQLTNDWYQNDSYEYIIIKGGSYYKPGGSWWYVQGGPKPLPYRQMLLRVSPGFERNATVGFRCVKDAR